MEASSARLDAEREEAQERARVTSRQNTRLRRLLAGLGITLAVALLAGALAVRSGTEAAAQREPPPPAARQATAISRTPGSGGC